jgi:hypothetical protein
MSNILNNNKKSKIYKFLILQTLFNSLTAIYLYFKINPEYKFSALLIVISSIVTINIIGLFYIGKLSKDKMYSDKNYKEVNEISDDTFDDLMQIKWKRLIVFFSLFWLSVIGFMLSGQFKFGDTFDAILVIIEFTGILGSAWMYLNIIKLQNLKTRDNIKVEHDERARLIYYKSMTYAFYSVIYAISLYTIINSISHFFDVFKIMTQLDLSFYLVCLTAISAITLAISYFKLYYK